MDVDRSHRRRRRIRARATDRVEDAVAWLLAALALSTVLLAFAVGGAGYAAAQDRARAEAAERVAVRAVLGEPATGYGPQQLPARWTGPDGIAVTGRVPVRDQRPAGAEVRVWLDRAGHVTDPPMPESAAAVVGWIRGLLVALCGWALLGLAWVGVRRTVAARNAAAWARDWRRVEPSWSGRAGT